MTPLAELFPRDDFRFHLTLRTTEPGEFFRAAGVGGQVLTERRHWLDSEPARHAALQPEGERLLEQFSQCVRAWGLVEHADADSPPLEQLRRLGCALEPDFLLLSREAEGQFRLRGGVLCFPTSWALEEKMGLAMDEIHGAVPGLNRAIGTSIHQFLSRLKPGRAFCRDNWGIAATDALNLHPARQLAAPSRPVALNRLWLRVEHQALLALPEGDGIVFGIRIALHRLDTVAADRAAAEGLRRSLATMPADLQAYKRVAAIAAELCAALA